VAQRWAVIATDVTCRLEEGSNPRIEGERSQHFVTFIAEPGERSTLFPSGQHFVDRMGPAAIRSTKCCR